MRNLFCKLLTPWKAEALFDEYDTFCQFLITCNRIYNTIRVILFGITFVMLMIGYATVPQPYNTVAVVCLVLALGATLLIAQNEKELPKELRQK